MDPEAHKRHLDDFLTPTGDLELDTQPPVNQFYKDTFNYVDEYDKQVARIPPLWRIDSVPSRILLIVIQQSAVNAWALWHDTAVANRNEHDASMAVDDFVAEAAKELYR